MGRNDETYHWSGLVIDEASRPLLVQRAFADAGTGGDTQIVAAVPGTPGSPCRIRVLAVAAITSAAVTVRFRSNTTAISAGWALAANGGFVLPRNQDGWFETNAGEALNVNLSGAANVGVQITYVLIPTP